MNDPKRFEQPIVVGAATDSYPFSYLSPERRCQGFSVDLLDAVARVMSMRIVRVTAPASEIVEMFQSGKLDMLQSLSPGPGRELYADFSAPHMELQGSFFVRKNETRFQSAAELNNAEVAIPGHNSIGQKYLRDNGINARLVHTRSVEESLNALNSGKHDAAFAARLSALSYIERDNLRNIRSLGQPLFGYEVRNCFAVQKGDTVLLAQLNEGLAILNRTGEFDAIYRKWFGRFDAPLFSREQVVNYVATLLAVALVITAWGFLRQRALRKHVAGQAKQIAENEAILAEAQKIAHLGHWNYDLASRQLNCSPETLRIFERDPALPPPSYARLLTLIPRAERSIAHRAIRSALRDSIACDITVPLRLRPNLLKVAHATARPLVDSAGRVIGLFGTIQDITRQRVAEEGLRAREQLLRALYDNVPIGMGVVESTETSFRFISANIGTARLLGLHSTALANRVLAELPLPTAVVEFWTHWFRQALGQPDIFKTEFFLEAARRHYAITLVPLASEISERRQLCFLIDDITERKEMDAEVAQGRRLRAIGELVGGIAHEFNNLLTPIVLKTDVLADEWSKDPHMSGELQTISQAARRGADLTRRLLTFGRRAETRHEEVRIHSLVTSNFDLLRPTVDRRIQLEMNVPETLPPLYLNPSDVHQILLNLLLNARDTLVERLARDATNTWNAQIRVEACEVGLGALDAAVVNGQRARSWIRLSVRDNGMGMPADVLERIFEPFYTTKEVGKGTGLGLATVWHLVTRIGGKVTVDSEPLTGSTFHVWLPVYAVRPEKTPQPATPEPLAAKLGAQILFVEDDELVGQTMSTVLRRMGHQVTHFANGNEAWQHLSTNLTYDLLLLDLDLPGISGVEIARRSRAAHYSGRILVASGRLSDSESRELDLLRVDGKLQKPFTPQVLNNAIQSCLAGTPLPAEHAGVLGGLSGSLRRAPA